MLRLNHNAREIRLRANDRVCMLRIMLLWGGHGHIMSISVHSLVRGNPSLQDMHFNESQSFHAPFPKTSDDSLSL